MKSSKLKIMCIALIAIILVATIFKTTVLSSSIENTSSIGNSVDDSKKTPAELDENNTIPYTTRDVSVYNNLYCIDKTTSLDEVVWIYKNLDNRDFAYRAVAMADITGNTATFYKYTYNSSGKLTNTKKLGTVTSSKNNIMAGLVSEPNPNSIVKSSQTIYKGLGAIVKKANPEYLSRYNCYYTITQRAVWNYYDTWLTKCEDVIGTTGFLHGYNDTYQMEGEDETKNEIAKNFVNAMTNPTKTYSAKLYFMKFIGDTETFAMQNLMLVEIEDKIEIPVTKVWSDSNNANGNRPSSITVNLLANGTKIKDLVLNSSNSWKGKFTELDKKDANGNEISYTIKEVKVTGYNKGTITGNASSGFTITNTLETTSVPVTKKWSDDNNRDGLRKTSVTVTLYSNGTSTGKSAVLNSSNNWKYTFGNLPKYKNGKLVTYTVKENAITGYTYATTGSQSTGFTITNTHTPAKLNIKVNKQWDDQDNLDDLRPTQINVTLYANGNVYKTATLNESNKWTYEFTNLFKYENGKEITYDVKEEVVTGYEEPQYTKTADSSGNITYTIKNTHNVHYDGYIEITGKVWRDVYLGKGNDYNGTQGEEDGLTEGIKIVLKDSNGDPIQSTYTDENGNLTRTDYAIPNKNDGTYTIRVNYDNRNNVYKLYENAEIVEQQVYGTDSNNDGVYENYGYVEFEYDGIKYTTVANATTGANTSKAKENETTRNDIDSKYSTVTPTTKSNITEAITASTKDVLKSFKKYEDQKTASSTETIKYCNGNGTDIHTNPENAWESLVNGTHTCNNCKNPLKTYDVDVQIIENVNLGLMEREQPDIALVSDLTKVEVTMNGQKYTYKYGVKSDDTKDVGLKAQFETKYTYEYKRPVNPADIAYLQEEANKNAMSVLVTYEIKLANLSKSLQITVHNITNYFDTEYTLNTPGWTTTPGTNFNKATYNGDLNITIQPQTKSDAIVLTYTVSIDAIRDLLNKDATLNHVSEIQSYSTIYGTETLYAEQRVGGERAGKPYAGYDYESHPGNAGIFVNSNDRLDAEKLESDTDIAPSFILCKDDPKTLAGTVFEDLDAKADEERLGDGKYDASSEKTVQNVKVELYDKNGNIAKLYEDPTSTESKDAVAYTDENGNYALKGVVTGEYFMKFTYGDDTDKLGTNATTIDGGTTTINARNYKSTIITNSKLKDLFELEYTNDAFDKNWHINIEDNYSVAVDNMLDRLEIEALQYSNFDNLLNMSAYTKPFKTQVEFDADGEGQANEEGKIENISNILSKLDFGIIERPREDLFVEKTITNITLTLANGQTLIDGNPSEQTLNYAKTMGFQQEFANGEAARKALPKRLLVEMDVELIQGAELELEYQVKVINNNELDYDYGNSGDYTDIVSSANAEGKYDNFISRDNKFAKYYYYGEGKDDLNEMQATIEFVDYLNKNVEYEGEWVAVDENLYEKGLISEGTNTAIQNKYYILKNASSTSITLARGQENAWTRDMLVRKSLANQDENVYDNSLEILKIDGKTARTIQESKDGEQVEKSYKPGNYVPANANGEQDDDLVEVIITPPTGIAKYITTYLIAGVVGLIVIAVAVIFIKKKVLTK